MESEFDVGDILEDRLPPDTESPEIVLQETEAPPATPSDKKDEIVSLRNRLQMWHENCRDLFIDLRDANYVCTPDDSYIEFGDKSVYEKRLYFKCDPQTPKDPKITLASQQFCKVLGVPHGFFTANRPSLKMNIVKTWQAGLTAAEHKAQSILKIRESKDCSIIRAFLSPTKCSIPLHELIDIILATVNVPVSMEFVCGDERDDLFLHARFLLEKEYKIFYPEETVLLGFSLVASELDAAPFILEVFLHDKLHATSYIASYGGDPFFKSKYEGIKASQIKDVFPQMLARINDEAPEMISRVTDKVNGKEIFNVEDGVMSILREKGLSGPIKKAIYHQVAECLEGIKSPWDLARHVGLVAKDFDSMKRLAVERAVGKYLQLTFGKE